MNRRDVTRVGTCCYCGARTMLELTARGGHELACGACGAPIHHMKGIRCGSRAAPARPSAKQPKRSPQPGYGAAAVASGYPAKASKSVKKKSKKSFKRKAKGVFDMFEDVFEDVFDLFD